jgi:hypothetical protein
VQATERKTIVYAPIGVPVERDRRKRCLLLDAYAKTRHKLTQTPALK